MLALSSEVLCVTIQPPHPAPRNSKLSRNSELATPFSFLLRIAKQSWIPYWKNSKWTKRTGWKNEPI